MNKNHILKFASWVIKAAMVLLLVAFFATIAITIHWHFDTSFYDHVYLENGFKAGMHTLNLVVSDHELTNTSLGSLSAANMYWLIARSLTLMVLALYALSVLSLIIRSIKDLETFYVQSIHSFNRLAILCFIMSIISFFNFEMTDQTINWHFTIPFPQILGAAICLVLREVFTEGMKLHEDSKSIV